LSVGKGKDVPGLDKVPRHEDVCGSGGIAPRILNLGTRWRRVVSFTPLPLYPSKKSPRYSLDRRLGEPESQSGRGSEEKQIPAPTVNGTQQKAAGKGTQRPTPIILTTVSTR